MDGFIGQHIVPAGLSDRYDHQRPAGAFPVGAEAYPARDLFPIRENFNGIGIDRCAFGKKIVEHAAVLKDIFCLRAAIAARIQRLGHIDLPGYDEASHFCVVAGRRDPLAEAGIA